MERIKTYPYLIVDNSKIFKEREKQARLEKTRPEIKKIIYEFEKYSHLEKDSLPKEFFL